MLNAPGVRKSRFAKTNTAIAAATTSGTHNFARTPRPHDAASVPRSLLGAPTSKRNGSRPFTRHGANAPFNVIYAAMPRNVSTTNDFRLPAPARISVLLPQPDASVVPKPKRNPPRRCDSHGTLTPM